MNNSEYYVYNIIYTIYVSHNTISMTVNELIFLHVLQTVIYYNYSPYYCELIQLNRD